MADDFGAELRRARVRKGLDVNTVARRLRIRPDIIQAIEESDFERMPPKGYARNMINSYAHLLGLNASEMTRRYLDEQYAHQVNSARKNARGTGFDMPTSARAGRQQRQSTHYEVSGYERGDLSQPRYAQPRNARPRDRYRGEERGGRRMYDDYDSGRIMNRSEAERTYRNGGHRSRGNALGEEPVFNAVASPARSNTFSSRFANLNLPMIAIVAVAVVLLVVLLVLIFGPKGSSDDASTMPVANLSESSEDSSSTIAANAPTSFTFAYTVNSGSSTWIEVYINGEKQIAENVEGPSTKTFTTSGELEFICADPTGVTAVQDGKDVSLTPNEQGVVDIKISFNDVLAAWQREHGISVTTSGSSSSSSLRGISSEATTATARDDETDGQADDGYSEDYYTDDTQEYYDSDYYDDSANVEDVEYYE